MDLADAVVAVTGAASGIGRASALAFAQAGADVVVSDIDIPGAEQVAAEVEQLGRRALVVGADVSERDQLTELVRASVSWQDHLEVFMSNAGVAVGGDPHRVPLEDWEWQLDINLWPHIWAVREVLPHMLERGRGHLVHTASSAGTLGFPSLIPYCVSKFAVVGLAESLAVWGADKGIGVSVVCPLLVDTRIMEGSRMTPDEDLDPETSERMGAAARTLFKQAGIPPEQVADHVLEAVREGRLYVFPHPELKAMVDAKWADPDEWVRTSAMAWEAQREAFRSMIATTPET